MSEKSASSSTSAVVDAVPGGEAIHGALYRYGLGVLFAANVFGAGSVYILADAGANFAFSLLWVLPLAFLIDIALHDMSARLAVADEPLADYIVDAVPIGGRALVIAISLMSALWAVSNYAVAGAALAWLLPGLDNVIVGIVLAGGTGIAIVQLKVYDRIEAAIAAAVFAVFGSYGLLLAGLDVPWQSVAAGLQPALNSDIGYLTTVIALLGTTVYWPNFFIQSSIQPTKEWTDVWKYRRDNAAGIATTLLIGSFVMIVSAVTLAQGDMTLTGPGQPLADIIGQGALLVFMIAVFLASITSATGTLFGAGFMIPQSMGAHTVFGDFRFRRTVIGLITVSAATALPLLVYTGFGPVEMAIIMPAVNGAIGLPVTVFALIGAVNRFYDIEWYENAAFVAAGLVLLIGSATTIQSLYETIVGIL
ncbi:Mn2+ and Fe2+ transporter of the NRAMP family- like protein [Haloterrigena turkmenica DSM 5511]|uniref:Mn2+ and Fe2+ transporter of the NRAMP family-like protein n=1 Tax=Haloterrigena turkmenica (strain ATCC 51198 / DSM 5511 / JCM 9101 / NCIMB 13204 / VKM B-1734 / 4k) TaxID=543526 RepID=D2RUI4_HALTV|nr:divalent metal cation transporter [Haloterrigena turkmenica]ADB61156.1 Mn2+ and Fe2+ transporter of the NRAMP family- like protein [Haloterrigena turkmenica DSM 5511]